MEQLRRANDAIAAAARNAGQRISGAVDAVGDAVNQAALAVNALYQGAKHGVDSLALQALSQASIRNLVYINAVDDVPVSDHVTSRELFFEAALIGLVCTVHNFFMAVIFGIAILIDYATAGNAARASYEAKNYLLISGISFACMACGLAGTAVPNWGAQANAGLAHLLSEASDDIQAFRGNRP
jgi:hypothetical protein